MAKENGVPGIILVIGFLIYLISKWWWLLLVISIIGLFAIIIHFAIKSDHKVKNTPKQNKYEDLSDYYAEQNDSGLCRANSKEPIDDNRILGLSKKIDTEEKAYWLGFIAADGCIGTNRNTIRVDLKIADKSHLEKLRTSISGN